MIVIDNLYGYQLEPGDLLLYPGDDESIVVDVAGVWDGYTVTARDQWGDDFEFHLPEMETLPVVVLNEPDFEE